MNAHQKMTLLVFGASTYLGSEVARLGRSLGHRIIAYTDKPDVPHLYEPWMHGVQWVAEAMPSLSDLPHVPPAALIYCDTALFDSKKRPLQEVLLHRPRFLLDQAVKLNPPPRFVLRSTVAQPLLPSSFTLLNRQAEELVSHSSLSFAILRFPTLYGPDRPDTVAASMITSATARLPFLSALQPHPTALRVETAALAMLRAALEPSIEGTLESSEIARIGDVMIPQ